MSLSAKDKQRCTFNHEVNGFIKYNEAIKFLAINKKDESWEFRALEQLQEKPFSKESKHRRMQTLQDQDSEILLSMPKKSSFKSKKNMDDEQSIHASQLDRVWNDHINTI